MSFAAFDSAHDEGGLPESAEAMRRFVQRAPRAAKGAAPGGEAAR